MKKKIFIAHIVSALFSV